MIKQNNTHNVEQGYTLLEVLIAMALGLFLVGILITVYIGAQGTFRTTNEVSRSQESTRFAVNFLTRDIRMAGYSNCSAAVSKQNLLNLDSDYYIPSMEYTVFGWEFGGTDTGDTYDLTYDTATDDVVTSTDVDSLRTSNSGSSNDWDSQIIQAAAPAAPTAVNLPDSIEGFEPLVGSDIIAVSISTPLDLVVANQPSQRTPALELLNSDLTSISATDIATGQIIKIGDCASIDTFQNVALATDTFVEIDDSSTPAPGNNFNALFNWQKSWDQSASVYEVETRIYYIGTGSSGTPALFRYSTLCGIDNSCGANSVELIDGIENMQVLYGEDTNGDDVADVFVSADSVANYANVTSVKLGLLMRSPDTSNVTGEDTYELLDSITIN
ncbi:MAG: PilW family protein, partial [Acidiferrobacterales bacterium]|nr:PilW family protein [Acidiferrobacterales bacterium]